MTRGFSETPKTLRRFAPAKINLALHVTGQRRDGYHLLDSLVAFTDVGDRVSVPCHHHQSVREHPGFTAVARATDGTVEAMEAPGDRFCVAVQWHPEKSVELALFHGLVAAATQRAR